jgi:hypothetical protein
MAETGRSFMAVPAGKWLGRCKEERVIVGQLVEANQMLSVDFNELRLEASRNLIRHFR